MPAFKNGDDVTVYIEYSMDEVAGVRGYLRVLSAMAAFHWVIASGSPLMLVPVLR
ncbi:MAG: hypothetical protein R2778_02030 [Saprospiraceae bacterium]